MSGLYPEQCALLIGTQDMVLSGALNRGYAVGRALARFTLLPPNSKRAGPTFHLLMETLP
jgi:hypothetical protein